MRKRTFCWLLILTMILSWSAACRAEENRAEGTYLLYFPVTRDVSYGAALATQEWEGKGIPTPEMLLEALLDGPTQEGMRSPFPGAVTLTALELDEEEQLLKVTLSEQYGGLTDMAQTLADACIVMTACQFPDIQRVEISSEGFWAVRPGSRTLSPAELELDPLLP